MSPFLSFLYLTGSSPPSPVLDRPPNLFIAMARVECASLEIEPNDIAPVENLFTISETGSTSSIFIGLFIFFILNKPLRFLSFFVWSSIRLEYFLKRL